MLKSILQTFLLIFLYNNRVFKFELYISNMLASIKKSTLKLKENLSSKMLKSRSLIKRHRKRILIVFLILASVALITTLVMQAIEGVDITNQAVLINYTQQKIIDSQKITNQVHLIGLNSNYFELPKRKFLLYFQQNPVSDKQYWSPRITARSLQGTKLLVSARVSCQIDPKNLKYFLEEYGLNWRIYPIQKSKNVIIQKIGQTKFYQMNNSLILSKVNAQFKSYAATIVNYPFTMKLISLKIEYPSDSFSVNNTLGIQLLGDKSLYSQLKSNYQRLSSNITNNMTDITSLSSKIGQLQSKIQLLEMQVNSMDPNWYAGLSTINSTLSNTQMRRFLWVYFQKVYNSTYNNYSFF